MPRLVKNAFSRLSTGTEFEVGPPCTYDDERGQLAVRRRHVRDGRAGRRGRGPPVRSPRRKAAPGARPAGRRGRARSPTARQDLESGVGRARPGSTRSTLHGARGPPATVAIVVPETASSRVGGPVAGQVAGRSAPPSPGRAPPGGARRGRAAPPAARRASSSNGRPPSCQSGPANSSSAGCSGRAWPRPRRPPRTGSTSRTRRRSRTGVASSRHTGRAPTPRARP